MRLPGPPGLITRPWSLQNQSRPSVPSSRMPDLIITTSHHVWHESAALEIGKERQGNVRK
jgi:hypothetical protein